MALSSKVVTFNVSTGTSNIAVTGVGFQPKALILLGAKRTATGQGANTHFNVGFATSATARGCVLSCADDGVSTTNASTRPYDTACYGALWDGNGSVGVLIDLVSLDSDGFTVVPDSNGEGVDHQVTVLCLGGSSLTNAFVLTSTIGGSTGSQSFTGVGFQPDCVLALVPSSVSYFGFASTSSQCIGLGWATSSSARGCVAVATQDGSTGTNSRSIIRTDAFMQYLTESADTVQMNIDFTSMDADGFTINRVTNVGSQTPPAVFLCLKGASVAVGSFAENTSTGTAAVSGLGFQPSALLVASTHGSTSTQTTPNAGMEIAVGFASAAAERGAIWAIDEDALGTSDNQSRYDTGGLLIDYAGSTGFAIEGEAELSSFDSDGFTLDTVDAFPAANLALYLALGSTVSSTLDQEGFRWYADDGSESGSTALAAQDTGLTQAAGTVGRIRFAIDATGDPATKQYKLQYKLSTDGTWSDIA